MRSAVLVPLVLMSCTTPTSSPNPPVEKPTTEESALEVYVPPPGSDSATLVVMRKGQDGYDKVPTRMSGAHEALIPLGEVVEFPILASTEAMVRLTIDGHNYLVDVAPNATLTLSDNPCNGWALSSSAWDTNLLEPPFIRCTPLAEQCVDGFAPSPLPGLADDPHCGDDERRCVATSRFTAGVQFHFLYPLIGGPSPSKPYEIGATFERGPTVCDWTDIQYGKDTVRFLPGAAKQWRLVAEDGELRAVAD